MKNYWPYIFIAIFLLISFTGCGTDQSSRDDLAPVKPVWVPRTADFVYPQQGIRAVPVDAGHAASHLVHIEWQANPETDVAGYRLWRIWENEPDPLNIVLVEDLSIGVDLQEGLSVYSWQDGGDNSLAPDIETGESRGFYWTLEAYDEAGNRSEKSDQVYFRLINNPINLHVSRLSADVYQLVWDYETNPDVILSYYMVRVYSNYGGPDSVAWYQSVQRYGPHPDPVVMDFSAPNNPMQTDCTFVCQLNAVCDRPNPELHSDSLAGSAAFTAFVYQN